MKDVLTKTHNLNVAEWEFIINSNSEVQSNIIERFISSMSNHSKINDSKKFNISISYIEKPLKEKDITNTYTVEGDGNKFIVRHYNFTATYDFDNQKGHLVNHIKDAVAIDAYLRFAVSYLSLIEGGGLIHSAGIIDNDNGCFIFPGPSLSGKTTLSKLLSEEFSYLGEELQIIIPLKDDDGYKVYGTPFLGSSKRTTEYGDCILKGIIFHRKSDNFYIREISYNDALFYILETVTIYINSKDISILALNNLESLLKNTKLFEMGFKLSSDWIKDFSKEVRNIRWH
ncbi:MAG: hypothetical protein ACUVWP_00360 [bacterium]